MKGCLGRVALAALLAISSVLHVGCGGAGADVSKFAGRWEGFWLLAVNHTKNGDISADITTDGTLTLKIDADVYVGRVLPGGVVVGIPPIGGVFELNEPSIWFVLSRDSEPILGYMDRVGSPPSSRQRWHDVDVESRRLAVKRE